jgi:ribonuclease HI
MFDTSYPLPQHAVGLTLTASGDLRVYIPGQQSDGHSFEVPATQAGLNAIVQVLKERQAAETHELTIRADMKAPTQHIVDQWLRNNSPVKPAPKPKRETARRVPLVNVDVSDLFS